MTITIIPPKGTSFLIRSRGRREKVGESLVRWSLFSKPIFLLKGEFQVGEAHPTYGSLCAKEGSTRNIRSHNAGRGARVEGHYRKSGTRGTMSNGIEFESS